MRVRFLLLILFSLWVPVALSQLSDPLRLQSGLISGTEASNPSVRVYKGVPFATPPVDDLRWHAPVPPPSWEGVRKTTEFSDGCVQVVAGSRPPWTEEFMHQGEVSEDCLYLNVWTAAENAGERRPVLVYIHGGGFNEGSGSVAVYDGEELAKKGLIVVTVNYRLGVLGFLAHPELTAESEHNASGNYGLLDQVAALQWVKQNIAAFGGDSSNVTIAGQSAGAMSVYALTASSLAKGLFHRAIIQSGPGGLASFGLTSTRTLARPLSEAEASGVEFATSKGATSLADLRAMTVAELTAAPAGGSPPPRFGLVIDGYFLPEDISSIYAKGAQNDVPTLTGFNADEASAFPGYGKATIEAFRKSAGERYGDSANVFLELYAADTDEEAGQLQKASLRDIGAVALQRLVAEREKTSKTDTYVYYFERGIPWPQHPEFGAFHTAEVPYVFNNLKHLDRPWEDLDRKLAETLSAYWVNFTATGNPNGPGLPPWPTYEESPQTLMVIGQKIGPRLMPEDANRRAFWDAQLSK